MKIDIIGVPIDLGADRRGVDMGPSAIRYAHLQKKLEDLGYTVNDEGNVEVPIAEMCKITNPKLKYIDCIIPMSRRVSGAVSTSIQAGNFPLVIGGDHSLSIGSVRGAARDRKLGVIWLDAHADFNTAETTPSGNIHGMSLAILCGLGDKSLVQLWDEPVPVIDPKNIAIIGARDLDEGEKRNLRDAGAMVMGMEQIDRYGMVACLEKAIERVSRDVDGIYLSLDLDSLDPEHAPGVGTPVPAGLTQREAHLACEMIGETGKLIGMDIVEVNPILDIQNRTALLAADFALSALGRRIWNGI
ncbi:MAG: arginase [Anaerolineales bacterium]|jgi:arginase|uniref:arginase n=1 Tax=Candidatus Villigracilis vicinus TaxID=3140679 RepID=UPI0031347BD6|nr:arginase [Anaerolineales bacterium]MBK7452125.1 arginase [Anaerolineales bacterium]MBK9780050.1 arginase [Anaerolineales bacterium]